MRDLYKKKIQEILQKLLRQLYPVRCPVCDRVLCDTYICPQCAGKLKYAVQPVCFSCGKPLADARAEYCGDCAGGGHAFTQGKAVWIYQGAVRSILYRFKYSNRRDYADFFAAEAVRLYGDWIRRHDIQAVIPIPLARKKRRLRGYNQAEVFARRISELLDLPVNEKLLVRVRETAPQKQLSVKERKNNLKNAFKISGNVVKLKRILLVDDIYTTGSTIDAAALALKQAGAAEVYSLCISIGQGN